MKNASKSLKTGKSWCDVLPVHPAAELFPLMPETELCELGEDIKANGLQVPITVGRECVGNVGEWFYQLLDGRNRLNAIELVGFNTIAAKRSQGLAHRHRQGMECGLDLFLGLPDRNGGNVAINYIPMPDDVFAFAASANVHRRHLIAEQKRELIGKLIKADPEKSDRQIAGIVKASPTTVGAVRHNMEKTGDVSKLDTHFDSRGRNQPARKPRDLEKERIAREERKRQARGNVPPLEEVASDEFLDDDGDFAAADLEADAACRIRGFLYRAHQSAFGAETDNLRWLVYTREMLEAAKAAAKAWNNVVALIEAKVAEKSGAPVATNNDNGLDIPASLRRVAL
jgi:hypothetical protein